MHHQFLHAAGFQRQCAVECAVGILDAEPHLGGDRNLARHRLAHGAGDALQQLGLLEQCRAAAIAIHQRRRTAEIEIDAGRVEQRQVGRVGGHDLRIGAEQLNAHRRTARSARAVLQFGTQAGEAGVRQHGGGDADEFGDAPVIAASRGQHCAQHIVGKTLHRGEDEAACHQSRLLQSIQWATGRMLICRPFFNLPMTCISHFLQSKRRVSFSLPLTRVIGSARRPFTSLGQRLKL